MSGTSQAASTRADVLFGHDAVLQIRSRPPAHSCAVPPPKSRRSHDRPAHWPSSAPPAPPCGWRARFRSSRRSRQSAPRATGWSPPRSPGTGDCPAIGPTPSLFAQLLRPVKAQDQAGDLRGADIQNGNHAALHGGLAHVPHRALGLVKIGHSSFSAGVDALRATQFGQGMGGQAQHWAVFDCADRRRHVAVQKVLGLVQRQSARSSAATGLFVGQQHALIAVKDQVPAPLAHPHQPAQARGQRAGGVRAGPAPRPRRRRRPRPRSAAGRRRSAARQQGPRPGARSASISIRPVVRAPDHNRHAFGDRDLQHAARHRPADRRTVTASSALDPGAHRVQVDIEATTSASVSASFARTASARSATAPSIDQQTDPEFRALLDTASRRSA